MPVAFLGLDWRPDDFVVFQLVPIQGGEVLAKLFVALESRLLEVGRQVQVAFFSVSRTTCQS